jgi:hypothetical protein
MCNHSVIRADGNLVCSKEEDALIVSLLLLDQGHDAKTRLSLAFASIKNAVIKK